MAFMEGKNLSFENHVFTLMQQSRSLILGRFWKMFQVTQISLKQIVVDQEIHTIVEILPVTLT